MPGSAAKTQVPNGTQPISDEDETDALPDSLDVTPYDLFWTFLSAVTYMGDLCYDMYLVHKFYQDGKTWYYSLTLAFALLPAMVMSAVSFYWYLLDRDKPDLPPVSRTRWACRGVCLVLFMAPIARYYDSLEYGWMNMKTENRLEKRKFFSLMLHQDADAVFLRLFEAFMESAPQFILHLYIYKADLTYDDGFFIPVGLAISLLSLAWSLTAYHRTMRFVLPNKGNLTWGATAMQFFWYLGLLASRLIALALFAVVLPGFLVVVCGAHWLVMTAWIMWQKGEACTNRCLQILFDIAMGFVYIFCYVNMKDDATRWRYVGYCTVYFLENATLLTFWYVQLYPHRWYDILLFIWALLAFFVGVAFMIMYYRYCHPKNTNKKQVEEFAIQHGVKRSLSMRDSRAESEM